MEEIVRDGDKLIITSTKETSYELSKGTIERDVILLTQRIETATRALTQLQSDLQKKQGLLAYFEQE